MDRLDGSGLERAVTAHREGRLAEAEAVYRLILRDDPSQAEAHHLLGVLCGQTGRREEGLLSIRRALTLNPSVARYHANIGKLLLDEGRVQESIAACRTAVALRADYAGGFNNLAAALNASGRYDEAEDASREALRCEPGMASAFNNLGNALRGRGLLDEAIAAYRSAVLADDRLAEAHNNLATVLKDVGRVPEAIESYRLALRLRPDFAEAHSNLVGTVHYDPAFDAAAILAEAQSWYARHRLEAPRRLRFDGRRIGRAEARLRVGYVSADFRLHPVGLNLLPLFRQHDRRGFEVVCYSGVRNPDALTDRFRALSDRWCETTALSDERLAETIRTDGIDILVDLSLHTAGSRLRVFTRRLAPVQVTFAGYPGTTGVGTVDYRLTDPHLDPPGGDDGLYAEQSVRLPQTFWCYDPATSEPVAPLPAEAGGYPTFGCLNSFCKINAAVLRLWASVMRRLPHSRLIMLAPPGSPRTDILALLAGEDVAAARVEFVGWRPREEYLRAYHRIDIALDTHPYNGHTTSLDALWMGVPVVTLVGRTAVGRAGLSQLMNLGLPELVARSPAEFTWIAEHLATDRPRLAELRATLRQRMAASPLADGARFARAIEAAYRDMWRRWCET